MKTTKRIATALGAASLCVSLGAVAGCGGAPEDSASGGSALSSTAGLDQPLLFDAQYYESLYPDLQAAFGSNLQAVHDHWLSNGIAEGRRASPIFDCHTYLQTYNDLSAAFGTDCAAAMSHFITQGLPNEGRQGSVEFDVPFYLSENPDLAAAFGSTGYLAAANHFMTTGLWIEGRGGSREFDVTYYLCHYADLVAAFSGDHRAAIQHWNAQGLPSEGRRGSSTFDVQTYIARYPDLSAAFGTDWQAGIQHFVSNGINEGRSGDPGDGGGPSACPGTPLTLDTSALATATGFPSTWFGFPVPNGGEAGLAALTGSLTVTNGTNDYTETLFIVQQLPSGACPSGQWPDSTPEFGPPGASGLGQFIVKAPAAGTFTVPIDIHFPGSVGLSNCLLIGINGGPVSSAHPTMSATNLTAWYGPKANSPILMGVGGEICFGQDWGCQAATTDNSKSFAVVAPIPISQPATLTAIYGDVSDTTFDGTTNFAPPPSGSWRTNNAVILYHASECAAFGGTGVVGPGDYFSSLSSSTEALVNAPATGSGIGVQTIPIDMNFSVPVVPGDCLVTLFGSSSAGGFDDETQLTAVIQ